MAGGRAIVELVFAYGLPDRPFIRTVLGEGVSLPPVEPGELVHQAAPGVYQRADSAGNWHRLNITTASDQNAKIGRDLKQRIGNIVDSLAVAKQLIKVQDGGKVWLGSESVNVLQILSDLTQVVADIANTASSHTHPYTDNGSTMNTRAPNQSGNFDAQQGSATDLKVKLEVIVEG